MTTDAAVADPVEETPTLVDQEIAPEIDATPAGDAGQQASSDAAPSTPESSAPDYAAEAAAAYQEEMASKGSEQQAPEPEQRRGIDPAVAAEAINRFKNGYGARQQRLDALAKRLTDAGYSQLEVEAISKETKEILNEHHADALNFAGYEAAMNERRVLVDAIAATVPQNIQTKVLDSLKPAEGQPQPPMAKVLKAFIDAAAAEAAAKADQAGFERGFVKGRSQGERTQSSAKSGQQVQGSPSGRSYASEDALHTAWNNREPGLTREMYAREYKRLTGRDL